MFLIKGFNDWHSTITDIIIYLTTVPQVDRYWRHKNVDLVLWEELWFKFVQLEWRKWQRVLAFDHGNEICQSRSSILFLNISFQLIESDQVYLETFCVVARPVNLFVFQIDGWLFNIKQGNVRRFRLWLIHVDVFWGAAFPIKVQNLVVGSILPDPKWFLNALFNINITLDFKRCLINFLYAFEVVFLLIGLSKDPHKINVVLRAIFSNWVLKTRHSLIQILRSIYFYLISAIVFMTSL